MAASLTWGVLSTVSTRGEGAEVGAPFGNPYSFADADAGTPYFYASALDASVIAALASTSPPANARATLALTEPRWRRRARACDVAAGGDPRTRRARGSCSRAGSSTRRARTRGGRGRRARAPPVVRAVPGRPRLLRREARLDGIWLIDTYGGAADIDVDAYRRSRRAPRPRPRRQVRRRRRSRAGRRERRLLPRVRVHVGRRGVHDRREGGHAVLRVAPAARAERLLLVLRARVVGGAGQVRQGGGRRDHSVMHLRMCTPRARVFAWRPHRRCPKASCR